MILSHVFDGNALGLPDDPVYSPAALRLDSAAFAGLVAWSGRAPECKSALPKAQAETAPSSQPASENGTGAFAKASLSRLRSSPEIQVNEGAAPDPQAQARCRIVAEVVEELTMMIGDRQQIRRDRRRMMTHVRQIAMYVSHVVLQVSLTDIGVAFGRDRTTVSYSCHVVEDRRDDADFDAFVSAIERVVTAVFQPTAEARHA